MLLYNQNPPTEEDDVQLMYRRASIEGVVHSAWMRGEHYEMSDSFDESWSCSSVCWAVDGEETYRFNNKQTFKMRSAGALTLGMGSRYTYSANRAAPFLSNMITFPHWISETAGNQPIQEETEQKLGLATKLFAPDRATQLLMEAIVLACRQGLSNNAYYEEASSLLFHKLLTGQEEKAASMQSISAAKKSTKEELHRRVNRAHEYILQSYPDSSLDLQSIAAFACLSKYHLIRVFKDMTGVTPMHFLATTRVETAMNLLKHTRSPLKTVIKAVGYEDRSAFYRVFTNRFNIPPSGVERPTCRHIT